MATPDSALKTSTKILWQKCGKNVPQWGLFQTTGDQQGRKAGKKKPHKNHGASVVWSGPGHLSIWWRRRESNPRPQVLYRQYYILSLVI